MCVQKDIAKIITVVMYNFQVVLSVVSLLAYLHI